MRALALLSGGIDSPTAVNMMIEKGADIVLVHYFNETITNTKVKNKIEQLAQKIADINNRKIKLYLVKFGEAQKEIIKNIEPKSRMIVYRRTMLRIGEEIIIKEKCEGFVTGDSLGQVASQTTENLEVIYRATKKSILTPLIGMNKNEIIQKARKYGTYEISILPGEDCCSFMIAKHPTTKAKIEDIEKEEAKIDFKTTIKNCLEKTEIKEFYSALINEGSSKSDL